MDSRAFTEMTVGRSPLASLDIDALRRAHKIVGRDLEVTSLCACVIAGRHVLLEGPVGVGKTVLARAVAEALGRQVIRVDGDGRFSEQKLVGHFDPPGVLQSGYCRETFQAGPLVQAMEQGAILFVNELNRMPEGVQNVLLPALDEHLVVVPQLGIQRAAPGFSVIATMNPREFVATGHLSEALLDRFELISLGAQTEAEEWEIVRLHARVAEVQEALVRGAVALVRATRAHPAIRRGASVRAAIAIVELASALGGIDALDRAAAMALPTRIELKEPREGAMAQVLEALLHEKKKG